MPDNQGGWVSGTICATLLHAFSDLPFQSFGRTHSHTLNLANLVIHLSCKLPRTIGDLIIRQRFGLLNYFLVDLQWRSGEGLYQVGILARSCIIPKNEEICIYLGRSAVPLADSQPKHAVFMLWLPALLMPHLRIGSFQFHLPQHNFEPDRHREKWFIHRYPQLSL